jgi:hypothetical protein
MMMMMMMMMMMNVTFTTERNSCVHPVLPFKGVSRGRTWSEYGYQGEQQSAHTSQA